MSGSVPDQDAGIFLAALDAPGAAFTFQTFDDTPAKRPGFAQVNQGTLAQHAGYLARMNDRGAGVFVTVNETDGMGRKAKNVQRVRAWFVDLDGAPLASVLTSAEPAHIIVESSPDRWHAYWLVQDCPLDQFKPAQKALAARFGGDDKVIDLPRVMRLPGFLHRKGEPFRTRIHQLVERPAYDFEALREAFGIERPVPSPRSAPTPRRAAGSEQQDLIDDLREALRSVSADDWKMWVDIGLALKTLGNDGSILWLEWSQSSSKFDMESAAREWERFKPTSIGHAFVFARAKECGWRPAEAPSVKRKRAVREAISSAPEIEPTPAPAEAAEQDAKPRSGKKRGPRSGKGGAHFEVSERGLYWHGVTADGDALPPIYVGPAIHIRARLRDEEESNWGRLVEFTDAGGTLHRWGLPGRILVKREEVMSELLRQGYEFAPTNANQNRLLEYLGQPHDVTFARSVERTGWQGRVYVLPDRVIGDEAEPVFFQTESLQGNVYQARGELSDWRTDVADLCRGNSRLVFAVCIGFAAILLHWTGGESGGFHFRGGSSSGKTTALRVAASVFGGPGYLRRWRATDNALEAVAAMHNDALLILDELAQVDPKMAGAAAYMLGNGEGKQRAFKTGSARPVQRWTIIFASAGEIGLAEHMRADNKRAQAGQEARLAEIPADAGAGLGLFETLHGYPDGAAFSRALLTAAAERHGTAAPAFITAVQSQLDTLPGKVRERCAEFCRRVLPSNADGQAARVADRFALAAVAGEFATERGITGWERGEATRAAEICFAAWIEQRGGAGNVEPARMIAQVRYFLERHGEARFQPWTISDTDKTKWTTNNRAGFRHGGESAFVEAEITYYVLPEVFREEVCIGFDYREVLRALDAAGAIKRDKTSRKFARRERLPGVGLAPCYVILPAIWTGLDAESSTPQEGSASKAAGTAGTAGTDS